MFLERIMRFRSLILKTGFILGLYRLTIGFQKGKMGFE
jgi:hypothetical protein